MDLCTACLPGEVGGARITQEKINRIGDALKGATRESLALQLPSLISDFLDVDVGGGILVDLQAALTAFGLTMDDVGEVLGLIEPALGDQSEEVGNMLSMIEGSLGRRLQKKEENPLDAWKAESPYA